MADEGASLLPLFSARLFKGWYNKLLDEGMRQSFAPRSLDRKNQDLRAEQ